MRAVIYARFSCSKQREASIDDQLRVCREFCAREGFEVVGEYCDYALSGRTDDRPEFQRMISNAGEAEAVIVYMLDRFSRDPYDAPHYKRKLRDRGVRLLSATESIPDTAEAVLIEKLYEGLAAVESAHISERTRRGMHGNALRCMHNGVPVFGYSYSEDGRYVVNDAEAEVVREVYGRRLRGETVNSIARDLAARGYLTTTGRPVGYSFVHTMLKNEKYAGVYLFGDVRVEGGMPAIVSREDWLMAQDVRPSRVREDWHEYAFSGRGICEGCGHNLVGYSAKGNGGNYFYYYCSKKCGVSPIRADALEAEVARRLRELLAGDGAREVAEAVAAYANGSDYDAKLARARKMAEDADRSIRNLTKAVADGMPYDLAAPEIERYRVSKAVAESEAVLIESAAFDVDDFVEFLRVGATLDDRALLDAFISQVWVGEDAVTVVLNYTQKSEPARLVLERVRTLSGWLPTPHGLLTVAGGALLWRFSRAA